MATDPLVRTRAPWRLGSLALPHRVLLGSMHTGLEAAGATAPGAWSAVPDARALAAFYRERVEGGAALVVTGGLAVDGPGRGGADYAVLTDPAAGEALASVTREVHEAGGLIAAQLFHAGRYALLADVTGATGEPEEAVAPSPVPWRAARGAVPRALTHAEVVATVRHFADAARAAVDAGFDAVEVMASEGYLLNQFCSPLTNLRDDAWGGDAARRRAFPLAVARAVRDAVGPDVPVLVRVSGDDLMPGSSTPDDVAALVRELVGTPDRPLADAVNVGVGWHESAVPTVQSAVPHGAWIPVAERVAAAVRTSARPGVPVIASNRFTDLRDVETVLARGTVDAVALARPFLADPAIVAKSLAGRFDLVTTCLGCDQACIDRSLVGERVSCLVNPRAGREVELPLPAVRSSWAGSRGVGESARRLPSGPSSLGASRQTHHDGAHSPRPPARSDAAFAARDHSDRPLGSCGPAGSASGGAGGAGAGGASASASTCAEVEGSSPRSRGIGSVSAQNPRPRRGAGPSGGGLAVVGGGPAGLAAAVDAARRGHGVTLLEARGHLGGQLELAARVPGKEDYAAAVAGLAAELAELGADVRLGVTAVAGDLAGFDGVVVATGVRPRRLRAGGEGGLPGADLPHVVDYETALRDGVPPGSVAIIGGGGVGVDVATFLVEEHDEGARADRFAARFGLQRARDLVGVARPQRWAAPRPTRFPTTSPRPGAQVTVLRRSGKVGTGIGVTSRWVVLGALRDAGVQMLTGVSYTRIRPGILEVMDADGAAREVPADVVVVCAGQEPVASLADELDRRGIARAVVGGARDARTLDAVRATREGLEAARSLLPDPSAAVVG
ncbi:FAD-dependent oxidoreductase [Luteimicrobium sp. NPDC057192]|uniref:oxidoreductase n=1 Tax=Luteimicrobium sp. NPDC057192 TaxID=3346042 RepID=UPI003626685E